jgi:hypothetical protein
MEIQKANSQLAAKSTLPALSQKLTLSILKLEHPNEKLQGKMELSEVIGQLMPSGRPDFPQMVAYPKVTELMVTQGKNNVHKLVFLLIKDFCASINVVRNMTDDQMIEAAAMLMDECGNFRLEDYTLMFAMAKRGQLIKIYDRIDIQVITDIMDSYWKNRHEAGKKAQEENIQHLDGLGPTTRQLDQMTPLETALNSFTDNFSGAIGEMKNKWLDFKPEKGLETAKGELQKNPNYRNLFPEPPPNNS